MNSTLLLRLAQAQACCVDVQSVLGSLQNQSVDRVWRTLLEGATEPSWAVVWPDLSMFWSQVL